MSKNSYYKFYNCKDIGTLAENYERKGNGTMFNGGYSNCRANWATAANKDKTTEKYIDM